MPFNEDILSDLPAPHEAEPTSLRRDILDELKDHLESAARREALKTSNLEEVEHNVLKKFGNPQKIARKLWFDAMKEKLIMQKVTLALVSLVAVASLAACGLMFSMARDFQSASTELLSQTREANAELLAQLSAIANREPEGPNLMEWVPLKIQVVKNDEAKTPAEGFKVRLLGPAISDTQSVSLAEETDETGIVDFGLVRPASYGASIEAPWGEKMSLSMVVKPGAPHVEKVVAPVAPPEAHPIKPIVQWPKELEGADVAVLVRFYRTDETNIGEHTWHPQHNERLLLIRPDGRFATYSEISQRSAHDNPSGPMNDRYVLKHTLRIDSEPEVSNEAFSFRGQQARLYGLNLVQLDQESDFPKAGDFLDFHFLHVLNPRFGKAHSFDAFYPVQTATQPAEEKTQVWSIEWGFEENVDLSRLMPMIERFSEFPPARVTQAMSSFSEKDQDENMEISEEEAEDSGSWPRWYKEPAMFPVSFQTYLEQWVKSQQE